jgi:DNA-binding response OmpR family regulator
MIVDDDPIHRSITRSALEDAGYSIVEAVDGVDALNRLDKAAPALVVLDAVMPNMDGFELCRRLRAGATTQNLPVLMATGLDDQASIASAYDAGATDFITKPVDGPTLVRRIRYLLRGAHRLEAARQELHRLRSSSRAQDDQFGV